MPFPKCHFGALEPQDHVPQLLWPLSCRDQPQELEALSPRPASAPRVGVLLHFLCREDLGRPLFTASREALGL